MANIKSAIKRARQSEKQRKHNASARSYYRTFVKKVIKAVASGNQEDARAAFAEAQPVLDKAAGRGIIHKNKAARLKSRLNARVKAMKA